MTHHLTPDLIEAAYELLLKARPFDKWGLPSADDVEFHVTRHRDRYGDCCINNRTGGYIIRISPRKHTRYGLAEVVTTVAHEMIHIYCDMNWPKEPAHGKSFKRCATRVCKLNGFDRFLF